VNWIFEIYSNARHLPVRIRPRKDAKHGLPCIDVERRRYWRGAMPRGGTSP
jgi:hypothetical protein